MCGPSHIWPAAIGTRAFFRQSVWRELNAKPGQMRSEDAAFGVKIGAQAHSGTRRFKDPRILIRIRQDRKAVIVRNRKKLARASRPGRASFLRFVSESIIAVADIHWAVGAPFPAAVISEEMAMMVVITTAKKAVAKMTAADPVAAMPAVTMTACESLAGDGQRSGGQRQSRNR